jgi:hypothetical protein
MQTYYRLYAKFEGQKRFKPLDMATGTQVTNLIHATMIPEFNLGILKQIIKDNSETQFKIIKIK